MRKKREVETFYSLCPSIREKKEIGNIPMPKELFKKNSIKIKVNYKDKKYCLIPYQKYVYVDYCDSIYSNNNWLYTDFGQIIAEINDGENNQYYCLTSPKNLNSENYLKMEVCNLNEKQQNWSFKKLTDTEYSLMSHSGKSMKIKSNDYLIEDTNDVKMQNNTLKILNFQEIKNRVSMPIIQFSVDISLSDTKKSKFSFYATSGGNIYNDNSLLLNGYRNYYNAHNNAFFSINGENTSYLCYYSRLIEEGGSSWDWAKNEPCSIQGELNSKYQWFFKKLENEEAYYIIDAGNNLLRFESNYSFGYTANRHWTESGDFMQNFILDPVASNFANTYSYRKH